MTTIYLFRIDINRTTLQKSNFDNNYNTDVDYRNSKKILAIQCFWWPLFLCV